MKHGQIIDADFYDGPPLEDHRETEARALPGANFASVYGFGVYNQARQELMSVASRYGYSERDRDAYWPTALARALTIHSWRGQKHGVADTPSLEQTDRAEERASHFLNAWKVMTGNDMQGGRLSAHERLGLAATVPEAFRSQARELRDEGVCHYVERCIELGLDMRNGERNRRYGEPIRGGSVSRGLKRQRQRVR